MALTPSVSEFAMQRAYRYELMGALKARLRVSAEGPNVLSNLDVMLRGALPGLDEFENACREWDHAAEMAEELRECWSRCKSAPKPPMPISPDTPLTLRNALHETAVTLAAIQPPGSGQYTLGYQAGLDGAIRQLRDYEERASPEGTEHLDRILVNALGLPPAPSGYGDRPGPPEEAVGLPGNDNEYHSLITSLLRDVHAEASAEDRAELARQLAEELPPPPTPSQLDFARVQWARCEETIVKLLSRIHARTGLTLAEAHSRAFIAGQLDKYADQLNPAGSAESAGFPRGFDAASRQAATIVRTCASQIRPPSANPVWQLKKAHPW